MRPTSLNGNSYYVEVQGEGEPLTLLHGFTGSSQTWQPHSKVLSQYFCTVAIDLLGHGHTEMPIEIARYTMDSAAANVAAIIQEIIHPPVHLLGYSMGGRLALYLAVHYPALVKTLVLESASPGLATETERQARCQSDEALADWIERHSIEAFVARWEQLPLWASQQQLPADVRQQLRQQRLQNNPTGLANSLRGMGTGAQPSLWPHLETLTIPTLLLAGALDEKFVAIGRQMAALLADAQLVVVPEAGHTIHLEQPEVFIQLVLGFLQNHLTV